MKELVYLEKEKMININNKHGVTQNVGDKWARRQSNFFFFFFLTGRIIFELESPAPNWKIVGFSHIKELHVDSGTLCCTCTLPILYPEGPFF